MWFMFYLAPSEEWEPSISKFYFKTEIEVTSLTQQLTRITAHKQPNECSQSKRNPE